MVVSTRNQVQMNCREFIAIGKGLVYGQMGGENLNTSEGNRMSNAFHSWLHNR